MPASTLRKAANAFLQSSLWLVYPEDALFAVRCPDGQTVYCGAMGGAHVAPSLMAYPGEGGLSSYYALRTLPQDAPAFRLEETLMLQDCLLCAWPAQGEPSLRRHLPYKAPAPVESAEDAAMLRWALHAAQALASRLYAQTQTMTPEMALSSLGLDGGAGFVPMLTVPSGDGQAFAFDQTQVPTDCRFAVESPALDEEAAQALRALPQAPAQTLACELVISPHTVPGTPPSHPVGLLMLDPKEGIVGMPVVDDYPAEHESLVAGLLAYMMENGRPRAIQTQDARTYMLLKNTAGQIGLTLQKVDALPDIDAVKAPFFQRKNA